MRYVVEARETGDFIDEYLTLEDAEQCIDAFEQEDKAEGIYERNCYSIR